MIPAIGSRITWRRGSSLLRMTVDLIHEQDGERWLFGAVKKDGGWIAVNQKQVITV